MFEEYCMGGSVAGTGAFSASPSLVLGFHRPNPVWTALLTFFKRLGSARGADESVELVELVDTGSNWHSSSKAGNRDVVCCRAFVEALASSVVGRSAAEEGIRLMPMLDWRRPVDGLRGGAEDWELGAEPLLGRPDSWGT